MRVPWMIAIALALLSPAAVRAAEPGPVDPSWTVDDGEPREVQPPDDGGEGGEAEDEVQDPDQEQVEDEGAGEHLAGTDDGFHFDFHGYYRARSHVIGNQMYPLESISADRKRTLRFMTQRLRLEPSAGYGEWVTLHVTIDALDNVLWGDNAGLSSTPLFASDPSLTSLAGSEVPSIIVKRAWIELMLPIGVLRVGRQPSHWGLGLLTNDGDGFDNDFGDKWYGTIYDRILFATKPISIGRVIAGLDAGDTPLILAVSWDKLVEDYLDPARPRASYDSGWLAGDDDDVDEWTVALAWDQDGLDWFGPDDRITAGFYFNYREQPSTQSDIYIIDAFVKLQLWDFFLEGEMDAILGSSLAIPLGPETPPDSGLYLPKDADILGGLLRVGWSRGMFTVKLETGYASGDADPSDAIFTGRALDPDVNVGLILYEELLAQRTREAWVDNEGLWSRGGVYNSYYFMTTGIVEPLPGLQITLGILTAWANEICDAVFQGMACADPGAHPNLGVELDASVRYRFYDDHILSVIEAGWLRPDNEAFGLVNSRGEDVYGLADTDMWTLQTRLAFVY
jgi:hypothetical protein